jgi:hypothetical protein
VEGQSAITDSYCIRRDEFSRFLRSALAVLEQNGIFDITDIKDVRFGGKGFRNDILTW